MKTALAVKSSKNLNLGSIANTAKVKRTKIYAETAAKALNSKF